jgi:hypothetical protein
MRWKPTRLSRAQPWAWGKKQMWGPSSCGPLAWTVHVTQPQEANPRLVIVFGWYVLTVFSVQLAMLTTRLSVWIKATSVLHLSTHAPAMARCLRPPFISIPASRQAARVTRWGTPDWATARQPRDVTHRAEGLGWRLPPTDPRVPVTQPCRRARAADRQPSRARGLKSQNPQTTTDHCGPCCPSASLPGPSRHSHCSPQRSRSRPGTPTSAASSGKVASRIDLQPQSRPGSQG